MATVNVVILDPSTSEPQKFVAVEARKQSDGTVIDLQTTNVHGVATFDITDDATFHARTSNAPPLYQVGHPIGEPFMNVDYVVDPAGQGTHTTLASAVAAAIAAGGSKTIWICSSITESDIDIGGIGASAILTIASHSQRSVVITANINEDIFKQDTNGGATDGGLRFRNVGLSIPTAGQAVFYVNTISQVVHLTFDACWFDMGAGTDPFVGRGYLAREDGSGLDGMGMRIANCTGRLEGFFDITGAAGQTPTVYFEALNNHLEMGSWWDGGANLGAPSVTHVSGGFYTLWGGIEYAGARNTQHFKNLYIVFHGATALFTTGAATSNIKDHSYTDITVQFQNNNGYFGEFGAQNGGDNDGLYFDGLFGIEASGIDVSGETFLVVDEDWTNVHVGDIYAPDFGALYSGPSTTMGVPMIVAPTFEVEGNADALNNRMVVIDATGTAWSAVEFQRSGTSKAAFGLWDTDAPGEFGANDFYFATNDGSWHDVAAFRNDGTVFELNVGLNVEGWLLVGADHSVDPTNTTDGDINALRVYLGADAAMEATAILEMKSTTLGLLPPRMTTAQRGAIGAPAVGLVVYDTDVNRLYLNVS